LGFSFQHRENQSVTEKNRENLLTKRKRGKEEYIQHFAFRHFFQTESGVISADPIFAYINRLNGRKDSCDYGDSEAAMSSFRR